MSGLSHHFERERADQLLGTRAEDNDGIPTSPPRVNLTFGRHTRYLMGLTVLALRVRAGRPVIRGDGRRVPVSREASAVTGDVTGKGSP